MKPMLNWKSAKYVAPALLLSLSSLWISMGSLAKLEDRLATLDLDAGQAHVSPGFAKRLSTDLLSGKTSHTSVAPRFDRIARAQRRLESDSHELGRQARRAIAWIVANIFAVLGLVAGLVKTGRELEERNSELLVASEQLRQSQRMDAVGRVAGGVAHDFNNLLTAILGYSDLSMRDLPDDSQLKGDLKTIHDTAGRAAELSRKLLSYSRKQVFQPKLLNLNELVRSLEKKLRAEAGALVELELRLDLSLWPVLVDPVQIERALLLLCENAREAMPEGGRLVVESSNSENMRQPRVRLSLRDEGAGLSDEVRKHLFEPFFTTKGAAGGTGLGLATCHGIVKQCGGEITVESAPGRGTTFNLFFPPVYESAKASEPPPAAGVGPDAVLLVEDEPAVRKLAARMLTQLGFQVFEAADSEEAQYIAKQDTKRRIRVLLTDIIMPNGNGKALAESVRRIRPDIRVIFTSGYPEGAVEARALGEGARFISKPFSLDTLARQLRDTLA